MYNEFCLTCERSCKQLPFIKILYCPYYVPKKDKETDTRVSKIGDLEQKKALKGHNKAFFEG